MFLSFLKTYVNRTTKVPVQVSDENPLPITGAVTISGGTVEITGTSANYDIANLIVQDSTTTQYIRRERIDEDGVITHSFENFDGTAATPIAPITAINVLPTGASTSTKQDALAGLITTMSGKFPAALGSKSGATSLSIVNSMGISPAQSAIDGILFLARATQALSATKYPAVQLWNPALSGKTYVIHTAQCWVSASQVVKAFLVNAKLAGAALTNPTINFKAGDAATSSEMYAESLTAVPTTAICLEVTVSTLVSSGLSCFAVTQVPVIPPGWGIVFVGLTASQAISAQFTQSEI